MAHIHAFSIMIAQPGAVFHCFPNVFHPFCIPFPRSRAAPAAGAHRARRQPRPESRTAIHTTLRPAAHGKPPCFPGKVQIKMHSPNTSVLNMCFGLMNRTHINISCGEKRCEHNDQCGVTTLVAVRRTHIFPSHSALSLPRPGARGAPRGAPHDER